MNLTICEKRRNALAAVGHMLVLGGPGSGKTTLALLKAQREIQQLKPGQEILFLSFSRAAVRQIVSRCKGVLTRAERQVIQVKTYHAFCLGMIQSHGRMLNGQHAKFVSPSSERLIRSDFSGDWSTESRRLAFEDARYCFDEFAPSVATLLETHSPLGKLLGEKFPFVVVDEFQDTGNDQWRLVKALAVNSRILCLADKDQRIFEYRADVDPRRIEILKEELELAEFDLAGENHRSSGAAGILSFADAVLKNAPLPTTNDVKLRTYHPNGMDSAIHSSVIWMFSELSQKGIVRPSIAVLGRTNEFVIRLSSALSETHMASGAQLKPVFHDVVWDADLSAAAALVLGTILEWPTLPKDRAIPATLAALGRYFRLKNADHPSQSARDAIRKFDEARAAVISGAIPRTKAARSLLGSFESSPGLTGDPVGDWKRVRDLLGLVPQLKEVQGAVRLVRLFRATDALASGLADLWREGGNYRGASGLVRRILERERLVGSERDAEGCVVMNMHKSKGKEFDGVVIVEGQFEAPFFSPYETPPHEQSRRLLRVAITRARSAVTILRWNRSGPLVG